MQPQSPTPQYDFILNNQPAPKKPGLLPTKMPGRLKIILIGIIGLMVLFIVGALLFGGGGSSSQPLLKIMSQAQEISRVSKLVQQQTKNNDTKALATTAAASLDSQKAELNGYLAGKKQKADPNTLAADLNKSTDSKMQIAAQNNSLEETYKTYLKTNLNSYSSQLQTAYSTASGEAKLVLNSAFASTQVILDSL